MKNGIVRNLLNKLVPTQIYMVIVTLALTQVCVGISTLVLTQACFANTTDDTSTAEETPPRVFYNEKRRGWYYHEQNPTAKKKKKAVAEQPPAPVLSPKEILKKQGEEYEQAAALAILQPSAASYRDYLEKTQKIMVQSEQFAKGLKQYTYIAPEFDYTLQNPQGNGVQIDNIAKNANMGTRLANSAQDNAIIFFFRSDCPYCHKYAPIIKSFAEQYGFVVLPISLDAKGLPEYPSPRYSPTLSEKLQVSVVPAVFLLNPTQNKVSTVGFGLTDSTTLGDKIIAALSRK